MAVRFMAPGSRVRRVSNTADELEPDDLSACASGSAVAAETASALEVSTSSRIEDVVGSGSRASCSILEASSSILDSSSASSEEGSSEASSWEFEEAPS